MFISGWVGGILRNFLLLGVTTMMEAARVSHEATRGVQQLCTAYLVWTCRASCETARQDSHAILQSSSTVPLLLLSRASAVLNCPPLLHEASSILLCSEPLLSSPPPKHHQCFRLLLEFQQSLSSYSIKSRHF